MMPIVRLAAVLSAAVLTATTITFGQAPSTEPPGAQRQTGGAGASSQMTQSESQAFARLQKLGYTDIKNVRSTPEGISARAMKDGTEVFLVVDSGGHVLRLPPN